MFNRFSPLTCPFQVPPPLLRLFSGEQLERLVCGAQKFDVPLLKSCTEYGPGMERSVEVRVYVKFYYSGQRNMYLRIHLHMTFVTVRPGTVTHTKPL